MRNSDFMCVYMSFAPTFGHKFWMNFRSNFVYTRAHWTLHLSIMNIVETASWKSSCRLFWASICGSFISQEKKGAFEKKISFEGLNHFVHTKFKFGLRSAWCGCKYSHYFIVHMKLVIYNYCPTLFLGYNFWYKFNFLGAQVIFPSLIFKQKDIYVSLRSCLG